MKTWIWCSALGLAAILNAAQDAPPVKVLMLVGGQYHDYDALPRALVNHLQPYLREAVSPAFTITKDLSVLRKEELSKYDAAIINVCEQTPVTRDERDGLLDSVRNGLPVVALHCTFWSFQDWPEFKEMLGAFVPGHAHFGPFCLEAAVPNSPLLKGVQPQFDLLDEPYIVNDREPSINTLIRSCKPIQGRPGLEPEVWTKMYGKGKIFAMTSGHDARSQDNPEYLRLLANGLQWALGRPN